MLRDIYTNCKINEVEQGAIFNGATSDNYINKEVYGIIITPRCDLFNGKIKYFNYLPVISFQDWLLKDFWEIFKYQLDITLRNSLKTLFENKEISPTIIDKFELRLVKDTYFSRFSKPKDQKKVEEIFSDLTELKKASKIIENTSLQMLMEKHKNLSKNIIKEISNNRNPNFHLIEPWDPTKAYHVILLREIRRLTYNIGVNLCKGIDSSALSKSDFERNDLDSHVDLYYLEKVMKSPYIEHLIQRFTNNFDKIGVDDHFSSLTDHLFSNSLK